MPYDWELGKMVWTKEDKIRAVVYLSVMFGFLILAFYFFGLKTQEAIDSGAFTDVDLKVLESWIGGITINAIIILSILVFVSLVISIYLDKKKEVGK